MSGKLAAGCPVRQEARCLDCACLLKKSVLLFFIFLKLLVWGKTKPPEGNPYGGGAQNCQHTVVLIQYIGDTPPEVDIFMLRCFETPQTERLSAFVTVAEARGNVKGFLEKRKR